MAYKNFSLESHGEGFVDNRLAFYKANAAAPTLPLLKKIHSCIDLTTLSNADNAKSVKALVEIVNTHSANHPDIPNVAGICVTVAVAVLVIFILLVWKDEDTKFLELSFKKQKS